jgi:hypothetical protein
MDWLWRPSDLAPWPGRRTTAGGTGRAAPVSSGPNAAEQQHADDDRRPSCDLKPSQLLLEQDVGGDAENAGKEDARTAVTAMPWRAETVNSEKLATSQIPPATTSGSARRVMRSLDVAVSGAATAATARIRAGSRTQVTGSCSPSLAMV